jgi:hypothetical protein
MWWRLRVPMVERIRMALGVPELCLARGPACYSLDQQ